MTTTCPNDLMEAINADVGITPTILQIVNVNGTSSIFEFDGDVDSAGASALDAILASWTCPANGETADGFEVVDGTEEQATDDTLWSSEHIVQYVQDAIAAVSAGDPNNVLGKTFSVQFNHHSRSAKNTWLYLFGSDSGNSSSDSVPFVLPWECKLISLMYTNQDDDVDCDIELWKSPVAQEPLYNKTKFHTIQVRNERTAVVTDFTGSDVTFSRGDKLAIYIKDRGRNSDYPVVHLTFLITSNVVGNVFENFSTNFDND